MFLPKGAIIKRELEKFVIEEETKRGYLHVRLPTWRGSSSTKSRATTRTTKTACMRPSRYRRRSFMLRPMTCPHHFQLYSHKPHSYRELPMRIAELAQLYRYEQSGELMGLIRTRSFCLADAHIICASEEQAMKR
jgi:threonyl-tRNA synthetase